MQGLGASSSKKAFTGIHQRQQAPWPALAPSLSFPCRAEKVLPNTEAATVLVRIGATDLGGAGNSQAETVELVGFELSGRDPNRVAGLTEKGETGTPSTSS